MQHALDRPSFIVRPGPSKWRETMVDLACALFAAVPLVLTAHTPLYDLPNHTAMLHVLLEHAGNPVFQKIYGVHWVFMPNMALQAVTWLLYHVMSIEAAVRLFCLATVLLLCAGTRALSLVLAAGAPGPRLYRAAPLLCWGAPLQYGFASYCFGVGLLLLGLALYLRLRHQPWPLLAAVFIPFGLVLLAAHLIAFGLFVAGLAGCELAFALQARHKTASLRARAAWLGRRAIMVASLTLPALIVLEFTPPIGKTAAPKFAHHLVWSTPILKAQGIAAITWFAMPRIEIPLLLAVIFCLVIALGFRVLRPHAVMLGIAGTLCALWLILPRDVPAGYDVDYRVPWAISFVVLAGLTAGPARPQPRRLREGLASALAVLVVLRIGSVGWRSWKWEPDIAAIDRALSTLPVGTSLWVIKGQLPGSFMKTPPIENTAAYLVTRRQGFEAQVFAGTAGEMVYLHPPYREMYDIVAPAAFTELPAGYDAALVLNPSLVSIPTSLALRCVAAGPDFLLLARGGAPSSCR